MNSRDLLRALMERSGDNPNSLAYKTKVPQPTIFRFLAGTAKEPRASTLEPIARYYGIPLEVFISDKARDAFVATWSEKELARPVAKTIKLLRMTRGISIDDLAARAGVTAQEVDAIENGGPPDAQALGGIARYFGLTETELSEAKIASLDEARSLLGKADRRAHAPSAPAMTSDEHGPSGDEAVYVGQYSREQRRIPVVGVAQMGENGYYDQLDYPVGHAAEYILTHSIDPDAYVLEARGDSMKPAIRNGWYVLVEPNAQAVAGEYVVLQLRSGQKMIKELLFQNRRGDVEVMSVNGATRISLEASQVESTQAVVGIFPPSQVRSF